MNKLEKPDLLNLILFDIIGGLLLYCGCCIATTGLQIAFCILSFCVLLTANHINYGFKKDIWKLYKWLEETKE